MKPIRIYCSTSSPRLAYVLDWIFRERLGVTYELTHDADEHIDIAYGMSTPDVLSIPCVSDLLRHTDIKPQHTAPGHWQNLPVLFGQEAGGYALPFDLFTAVFYLISRYEEYLPYQPDKHGRYPAQSSILFRQNLLHRPIVDEWIHAFAQLLTDRSIPVDPPEFQFQPTYDIDIAYSFLHKGVSRNIGGMAKDLKAGNTVGLMDRMRSLTGQQKDPYDAFDDMMALHKSAPVKPLIFILSALHTTDFDKNIDPNEPAMQQLTRQLAGIGTIGLHPSYYSDKGPAFDRERAVLERNAGVQITISRQHYIRFKMPETCRSLIQKGMTDDHSMGYGAHLGFRAGTGASFLWFDLENNVSTRLRLHPFCFMDTTARFEADLSAEAAFDTLHDMTKVLRQCNSTLVTIFHNFSLGTDSGWKGWPEKYRQFIAAQTG